MRISENSSILQKLHTIALNQHIDDLNILSAINNPPIDKETKARAKGSKCETFPVDVPGTFFISRRFNEVRKTSTIRSMVT